MLQVNDEVAFTTELPKILKHFTDKETKDWKNLIKYTQKFNISERRKYAWLWPTVGELLKLKEVFHKHEIRNILSIGCGNGLLEWLLSESIDLHIAGVEVDENWWSSRYAVRSFIPLNFIDANLEYRSDFLQKCANTNNWKFALLFCYFNNADAFRQYLKTYKGDCVILIGPRSHLSNIHTEPMPLELSKYTELAFKLIAEISVGTNDVIAIYKKTK